MTKTKFQQWVESFPWVVNEDVPWAPPKAPNQRLRFAIVTTGGLYTREQEPFAIKNRDDVDEGFRVIPSDISLAELSIAHEHYDHQFAEKDMNVVFPLDRFRELQEAGEIGSLAPRAYSISGFIPKPDKIYDTAREIARMMKEDGVEAAFLTPV